MATSLATGDVVVDSTLVVEEVLVDGEGSLHGSVVVKLGLDARYSGGVNDSTSLALVLCPGLTGAGAGLSADTGVTAAGGVGPAFLCDNTSVGEVSPNVVEVTTVAAVVVCIARDWVLGSENEVLTGDAESVGESLSGTESPA